MLDVIIKILQTPATCTMGLVFCLLWIGTLNAVSVDPCLNYREVEAVEVVHLREGLLGALVNLEGEDFEMHGVMKVMICQTELIGRNSYGI